MLKVKVFGMVTLSALLSLYILHPVLKVPKSISKKSTPDDSGPYYEMACKSDRFVGH